ncbi:MAG: hypothetical protein LUF04_09355 [Bacteroides sp.]|nr:hypothetical protein [Bacteroides sp.]
MKKIFSLFAVAALIFAGCSKDNDGGTVTKGEDMQFYLKIAQENAKTRADAGQITGGKVNFSEGAIFFADDNENFVRYVRITNDLVTGTVSAEDLEKGYLFNGISNIATKVYVVGGHNFAGTTSIKNKGELDAIIVDLKDQSDYDFGVSNANLVGSGAIVAIGASGKIDPSVPGFNTNDYAKATHEAYIEVKPLIARFEIEKITGIGIDDGWVLEGIYVDNFFYKSSLFASYSDWNEYPWTAKGDTYNRYDRLGGTTSNYSNPDWNPILFDDGSYDYTNRIVNSNPTTLGTGTYPNSITPANGAWAYNIFADAGNVPNIVLKLSNVYVDGTIRVNQTMDELAATPGYSHNVGDYDGIAFLTVTGYNEGGAPVTIEGGHVYVIRDLKFKAGGNNNGGDGEDDTRDEPKGPKDPDDPDPDKKFDVFVQIELMEWQVVPVDVEFN